MADTIQIAIKEFEDLKRHLDDANKLAAQLVLNINIVRFRIDALIEKEKDFDDEPTKPGTPDSKHHR